MATSQNGWPVLESHQLRRWLVPDKSGKPLRNRNGQPVVLPLAPGAAGFVLVHLASWYNDRIERLDVQAVPDDWGWADRPIRDSSETSNHASGTAEDLNATRHPLGVRTLATFTRGQARRIRRRLRIVYLGCIRWGGDYQNRPDAMHWELDRARPSIRALARVLARTPRGRRIVKLNPWR